MPHVLLSQSIATNIKAEMARRDVTQASLAGKLGVSQQFISRRLSGKVPLSVDELGDIAAAIGVPLVDLVDERATHRQQERAS
jgi:transcriptional regulator with XRE-family HTH domain